MNNATVIEKLNSNSPTHWLTSASIPVTALNAAHWSLRERQISRWTFIQELRPERKSKR